VTDPTTLLRIAGLPNQPEMFSYHAVVDKKKRSAPLTTTRSEDKETNTTERRTLVATARDLPRNFAVAAWMLRKHLDYVSRFSFQAKTGNDILDAQIEALMARWSRARNCDAAGRHSLSRMIRLAECCRVLDGDVALVKLGDGRLQAIEGDRIAKPTVGDGAPGWDEEKVTAGVELNGTGAATRYCICKRSTMSQGNTSLAFDRWVSAADVIFHGYFTRFDQVRGVSPLSTAINTLQDLYEGFDYNLIKTKMHAMFGLAILRQGGLTDGFDYAGTSTTNAEGNTVTRYDYDLRPGLKLELDPGDTIETIESKTPAAEFVAFCELMLKVALLALDIPYTFFDSRESSYSGARQDMLQYDEAAEVKRADNQEILNAITDWKLAAWVDSNELALPPGMPLTDVRYEWQPAGLPWIDPLKEVEADIAAINAGLLSRTRACKARGYDFDDILAELAAEQAEAIEQGVSLKAEVNPSPRATEGAANAGTE